MIRTLDYQQIESGIKQRNVTSRQSPESGSRHDEFGVRDVVASYDVEARTLVPEYERLSFEEVHEPEPVLDRLDLGNRPNPAVGTTNSAFAPSYLRPASRLGRNTPPQATGIEPEPSNITRTRLVAPVVPIRFSTESDTVSLTRASDTTANSNAPNRLERTENTPRPPNAAMAVARSASMPVSAPSGG